MTQYPSQHDMVETDIFADARRLYPNSTQNAGQILPLSDAEQRALMRLANLQFTPRMNAVILAHFKWSAEAIFEASDSEFEEVPGFLPRQLVKLRHPITHVTDRQWRWMQMTKSQILVANRPDFPRLLLEISDCPPVLFMRGTWQGDDAHGLGIVGSRNATPYGLNVAERLSRELAENGVTVISGGALGIDAAAHSGALDAGGRTIAILGCGIDINYPRQNEEIFERIINSGAVISEYALGSSPESFRFPQRNRIISGLSLGTLVVEAPRQSGSLITARYAAEQGRTVLTVPANIDRPNSLGSNDLLKDGAIPVTETEDILLALRLVAVPARKTDQIALGFEDDEVPAKGPAAQKNKPASIDKLCEGLPDSQRRLVLQLTETPVHIDTLATGAGLSAATAGVEMTMLELAGLVRRLPGNTYILAIGM